MCLLVSCSRYGRGMHCPVSIRLTESQKNFKFDTLATSLLTLGVKVARPVNG